MAQTPVDRFTVDCPSCGKHVQASTAHVGKKGRCGRCQHVFAIQHPGDNRGATAPDDIDDVRSSPSPSTQAKTRATVAGGGGHSLWDALPTSPAQEARQAAVSGDVDFRFQPQPVTPSLLANDYMQRASSRNDESFIQQEERNPQYRFMTSYGSVIGGISTICFGLFILLPIFGYLMFSARGIALAITAIIAGAGWLVQGLNYVTYYRWKDQQG